MKYKFLRISLLSALAVLFGGTALGAFMAAAEAADDDAGDGGSETVTYAVQDGETHKAGETVEVKNGDDVVATLTFGVDGDEKDFTAPKKDDKRLTGFWGYTEGNGVNPTVTNGVATVGTVYTIKPKYDGSMEAAVVLNNGKNFYVLEDGTALADYDGITVETKYQGIYKFDVKGGSEYIIYCSGSKLGFYGFNYTYVPSAAGGEVEEPESETPSIFPITEDFEGETSIFEGGEVLNDEKVGSNVLVLNNTTATASFSPAYTLAKDEKVTFKFTAYQGWVNPGLATATVMNSEGQDLVSYTYDQNACNVTDVAIGGTTVDGFEVFFGQSNSTNAASKGSANIFGHANQPFVATEGYNPQVTLSISGAGAVEFNLQYTGAGNQDINVSYSGTLPEGTTIDLGSFALAATGKANAFGIDNLSITTATEDNVEDPALAEMKEMLSQMVAQYEGADLSDYTDESAAAFTKAIEDVKAEIANPNATEESLMAVYYALAEALQGLEEKPAVGEGSWEKVGTAILEDPWVLPGLGIDQHADENKWEVPLERNTANENLYRLVDPYHAEGPVKAYNESEEVGYIVFDVTDPDHVLFAPNTGVGFKNRTSDISIKVNEIYAYNRLTQIYYHKKNGAEDLATVIADYSEAIPFTTFKDGVITLGSITVDGETIYDACFGDNSDPKGLPDGFDWENGADMTGTITLKIGETGNETAARRWDFTTWSDATVANLIADAAQGVTEGWSDVEKNGDTAPTETSKDNCFWSINTPDEIGGLSANNVLIDELKGLKFGKNVNDRGMAIAVNYPTTSLGNYEGGAYLWLGGKNKEFFTIPAVAGGSTIKMGVESHNTSDTRGVNLLVNGASIGQFTPTTYAENTWTVPAGEAVDVVVDNTNGCHIYFIEVEQDQEALLAVATADLKTVIAAVEAIEDLGIYTEESVEALNAALTAAEAAEGTIEAQTEAAYALLDAKAALSEIVVDDPLAEVKESLSAAIANAEAIDKTLYTAETVEALTKAIEDGKAALEAADATEATLTAAIAAIADAVAALEELDVEVYDFQELCMALYPTYGAGPYAVNNGGDAGFTVDGATMHYLGDYTDEGFAWNQRFAYEYVEANGADRAKFTMRNKSNKKDGNCGMFSWDYAHKFSILGLRNGDQVMITVGAEKVTFVSTNVEGEVEAGSDVVSGQVYTIATEEKTTRLDIEMPAKSLIAKILIYNTGEAVGDDEPTGINAINAEAGNGTVYNLQGQKVEKAQKGLYIINGKKVVMK